MKLKNIVLFLILILISSSANVVCAMSNVGVASTQGQNMVCSKDDLDCMEQKVLCPEDLSSEECAEYKTGQVLAGRTEKLVAVAHVDDTALIDNYVRFTAKESNIPEYLGDDVNFLWDFGDLSEPESGLDVKHIYDEPGNYTIKLSVQASGQVAEDQTVVKVVEKAVFLITSKSNDVIALKNVINQAERLGVLIHVLEIDESGNEFNTEDILIGNFLERIEDIKQSDLILGWTNNSVEVNALVRFGKHLESSGFFSNKSVVIVSDRGRVISRRSQPIYDVLLPENVLVVNSPLIESVIVGEAKDTLIKSVQAHGKGFVLLGVHSRRNFGKLRFYNFLSHFINSLINKGASINTILLVLMLPIVATIICLARQVVGIKAFGIYIPTILTLIFVVIGIQAGLLIMLIILCAGTIVKIAIKKLRLLYLPRMALLITSVSMSVLIVFYFSARLHSLSLLSISIFPILILIMLIEEFIKVQIQEGVRNATILTLETIILSVVSFYVVSWDVMRNLLLAYPEIILLSFVINLALGKWTGLRLWEYYRFKEVIKSLSLLEKKK